MAGTSGNSVRWGIVPETVPGTTPTTPAFIKSAFENISLEAPPNIRENRGVSAGRRRTGMGRSGFTVTGEARGKMIYGVYDDYLASLLQGAWASDVLKDSVTGQTAFTVENTSPAGVGGTDTYLRYRGVEFSGGSITLTAEEDAAVEFAMLGLGADASTTSAITGATYADPSNEAVLGSGSDVGTVTMGSFTLPCIRSLTMNFNIEDKERQARIGNDDLCGMRRGSLLPILDIEFYIEDGFAELYDAARTGTEFSMTVPIGSLSGEKYTFVFPRCQIGNADPIPDDANYFQTAQVFPLYDITSNSVVTVTRAIA